MTPPPIETPSSSLRGRASLTARGLTVGITLFFALCLLFVIGATRDPVSAQETEETSSENASVIENSSELEPSDEVDEEPAAETTTVPSEDSELVSPSEPNESRQDPALTLEDEATALEETDAEATDLEPVTETDPIVEIALVAPPAVTQCNADTFPTTAGWEGTCRVTIENTLGGDGSTSSIVTTTTCLAAAGVLPPAGCTSETVSSNQLVTTVDQCNGIFAGGSNLTCSVNVFNNVPAGTPTTGVTVNQCIGSGQGGVSPDGPPTDCDPPDSSTSGATVTQCNGSANGGGAPRRVTCWVVGSVTAIPMTVNQCNGSTAAGSTVTCAVEFINIIGGTVVTDGTGGTGGTEGTAGLGGTTTPSATDRSTRGGAAGIGGTAGLRSRSASSTSSRLTGTDSSTGLPATGASVAPLLAAAMLFMLLGGLLVGGSKRRMA